MPIKTVHITTYYHKNSGGISTSYNKLLEAANRHERYVRLIVPGEETTVEEVGEYGRIYYIQANPSPIIDKRYRLMMPWKAFMPDGAPVKTILRREKPDLIEIGEKYTLSIMAGLLRTRRMNVTPKRPLLVHSTCERMDDNALAFIGTWRIINWLTRMYMRNYNVPMFDFHVSNSEYTQRELSDTAPLPNRKGLSTAVSNFCLNFWRTPKIDLTERLFINECGVDLDVFSPSRRSAEKRNEILRRFALPEDTIVLLYAGRISPEKNLNLLPETMKALGEMNRPEFRLLLVGAGPFQKSLIAKGSQVCPGKVTFAGQIGNKEDLADIYANCDAFLHSNPREPFGIAPLEAMASGLPLIAPRAGGVLSYANDENAWLANPTAIDFAAAVLEMTDDLASRERKVANALQTSQRYSWEASTDARFAMYDQMFETFTSRRPLFDYVPEPVGIDYSR